MSGGYTDPMNFKYNFKYPVDVPEFWVFSITKDKNGNNSLKEYR